VQPANDDIERELVSLVERWRVTADRVELHTALTELAARLQNERHGKAQ
jgi:hypothetical protein